MPGSARPPLTSLTSRAPAPSARSATRTRMVSMLTTTSASASAVTTGLTRRSSSSSLIRNAPGLVDSPPTSTMSAPAAASLRPCAIASSGPNHFPPSENESGVTLITPMTRHLAAAGRPGGLIAGPAMGVIYKPGRCRSVLGSLLLRRWLARLLDGVAQHLHDPPRLDLRPDQESLGLQRRESDPDRVLGRGEDHEPGYPFGRELRVELVERLDLEPLGHEDEDAAPGARDRAGPDTLAALERSPEGGEVQRDVRHAKIGRRFDGLGDHEIVEARLRRPVPAHQVK